jgi:2-Cys peroxiredoxin 5
LSTALGIKVGDKLPDVELDINFPPEKVSVSSLCLGKKIVVVGLPGAFTPT